MISLRILPDTPEPHGLTPGRHYLFDDHEAGVYLTRGWASVDAGTVTLAAGKWDWHDLVTGPHLIVRSGGFGDLICLRPALAAFLRQHPDVDRLAVACHPAHAAALDGLEGVEVLPYPVPAAVVAEFFNVISLEGVIESASEAAGDSVSLLAQAVLDRPAAAMIEAPTYAVPESARAAAWQRWPRTDRPRLGIGLHSSALVRDWPMERLSELLHELQTHGPQVEVFLFGNAGIGSQIEVEGDLPNLHILPHHGLDLRQSLAVLSTMDAFVGPDSGLIHAAGAMRIPTLALFGPFEPRQRVQCYPTVQSLAGRAPCAPCHHHPRTPEQTWPPGKPCQTHHHCLAMANLRGTEVAARIRGMLAALRAE
jgi:ADP-heptose:LPS heptosyltransferase